MSEADSRELPEWLGEARQNHRGLFSELDVLLKSLQSFFVIENLSIAGDEVAGKNFRNELAAAGDAILRVISVLELIIPEKLRNAYWFQKFAEYRLLSGKERTSSLRRFYNQDTQEKSLYFLYDSMVNAKTLVADILNNQHIRYMSFANFGQLLNWELSMNVFFNPSSSDIDRELDPIENRAISSTVKGIQDKELKRKVSMIYLFLFRLLRYLSHVKHSSFNRPSLNCSLLILILLKAEIGRISQYLKSLSEKNAQEEFGMLLMSLSYQFSMESKRVYQQELKGAFDVKTAQKLRGKVESGHGILRNAIEQAVVQTVKYWNPEINEEEIFEIFITKTTQSVKLREDIYVLHLLLTKLEHETPGSEKWLESMAVTAKFMEYFESFTFKLLRYDDYEAFHGIFESIKSLMDKDETDKLRKKLHELEILLETSLSQIGHRSDLSGKPLDKQKAEDTVDNIYQTYKVRRHHG